MAENYGEILTIPPTPGMLSDVSHGSSFQLSNEKKNGCLGYIGDSTTQLCGDKD